jgi:hypothetical protein
VKFELEPAEDDRVYAAPAQVMRQLDRLIGGAVERVLADGEFALTVAILCEPRRVCVRIGDAEC